MSENLYQKRIDGIFKISDYITESFDKSVNIIHRTKSGHIQHYLHWHPHYEIQLILCGDYTIINNNFSLHANKPIILVHCPFSLHAGNADLNQTYEFYIVSVKRPLVAKLDNLELTLPKGSTMMYAFPTPDELMELVTLTDSMNMRSHDDTYNTLYTALIMKLVAHMIADGRGESICSNITYIQEVLRIISENLSTPFTALELSSYFGISKTKFHRDFRMATGSRYKEYLDNIRLSYAYVCFVRGMDIVSTSLECGYSSESHFIYAFRQFYGMTPGECIQRIKDGTLPKFD